MCGRYTLHHSAAQVADRFDAQEVLLQFPQRYNIAPTQPVPVVTCNSFGDGKRVLEGMMWGLVPSWAKDHGIGQRMINARVETVGEKPVYKRLLGRRRCLVPSDGFYEWKTLAKAKQPMHIRFKDGRLFAFAGLWDEWQSPDGSPLRTCTIITGTPNALLNGIHDRMAMILNPEAEAAWLDPTVKGPEALQVLQVHPDTDLEAFAVHKQVGNVAFDSPECILSVECPEDPSGPPTVSEQLRLL